MIVMPKSLQHQLQINYNSLSISALSSNMLTLLLTQKKKKKNVKKVILKYVILSAIFPATNSNFSSGLLLLWFIISNPLLRIRPYKNIEIELRVTNRVRSHQQVIENASAMQNAVDIGETCSN